MKELFGLEGHASQLAGEVDSVFLFILAVGAFFFVVTQGALIYFAIKYRRKKGDKEAATPDIRYNVPLEAAFLIVPSVLVFAIFWYGYTVFLHMRAPEPGAAEIGVVAKEWLWEFTYPDGRRAVNELRVPVGKPVKLNMTSEDVIHSLYIPEFRDKQDILPGRYTQMWLRPEKKGEYQIFCAEYCGQGHSQMLAMLVVMEPHEYEEWVKGQTEEEVSAIPPARRGEKLVRESGCLSCHSLDGTAKVGPTLKGIFGRKVELADGTTVTADDNYLKESLVDPAAKVTKGYQPIMPTFKSTLSDRDITDIIAYFKEPDGGREEPEGETKREPAVKETPPAHDESGLAERGEHLAESKGCTACHSTDGSAKVGPTFKGLYGRAVTLTDGSTVTADDAYITESIRVPSAKLVQGYPPVMPPFADTLTGEETAAITGYIKTLR